MLWCLARLLGNHSQSIMFVAPPWDWRHNVRMLYSSQHDYRKWRRQQVQTTWFGEHVGERVHMGGLVTAHRRDYWHWCALWLARRFGWTLVAGEVLGCKHHINLEFLPQLKFVSNYGFKLSVVGIKLCWKLCFWVFERIWESNIRLYPISMNEFYGICLYGNCLSTLIYDLKTNHAGQVCVVTMHSVLAIDHIATTFDLITNQGRI